LTGYAISSASWAKNYWFGYSSFNLMAVHWAETDYSPDVLSEGKGKGKVLFIYLHRIHWQTLPSYHIAIKWMLLACLPATSF